MSFAEPEDRKSTRLNSSHQILSYAVFCLKKKMDGKHFWSIRMSISSRRRNNWLKSRGWRLQKCAALGLNPKLRCSRTPVSFFVNGTARTKSYTLSLHDALPI